MDLYVPNFGGPKNLGLVMIIIILCIEIFAVLKIFWQNFQFQGTDFIFSIVYCNHCTKNRYQNFKLTTHPVKSQTVWKKTQPENKYKINTY